MERAAVPRWDFCFTNVIFIPYIVQRIGSIKQLFWAACAHVFRGDVFLLRRHRSVQRTVLTGRMS